MNIPNKDGKTTRIRGQMPPPSKRFQDKKKAANKKACRSKVDNKDS